MYSDVTPSDARSHKQRRLEKTSGTPWKSSRGLSDHGQNNIAEQRPCLTGCCFAVFASKKDADNAIQVLHGKHTMPGMSNPIQLARKKSSMLSCLLVSNKGPDCERRGLSNAILTGMLAKHTTEEELKQVFSPYGNVDEVYIMKDKATNTSKGCAFVKYTTKHEASVAIQNLHQKTTLPGATQVRSHKYLTLSQRLISSQPLIVKWADPPKTKTNQSQPAVAMDAAAAMSNLQQLYMQQVPSLLLSDRLAPTTAIGSAATVGTTTAAGDIPCYLRTRSHFHGREWITRQGCMKNIGRSSRLSVTFREWPKETFQEEECTPVQVEALIRKITSTD
eukprot:752736-Hanusia_phi.AAC.4